MNFYRFLKKRVKKTPEKERTKRMGKFFFFGGGGKKGGKRKTEYYVHVKRNYGIRAQHFGFILNSAQPNNQKHDLQLLLSNLFRYRRVFDSVVSNKLGNPRNLSRSEKFTEFEHEIVVLLIKFHVNLTSN